MLSHIHRPIDAELWGSDMIGALSGRGRGHPTSWRSSPPRWCPPPRRARTPEALALLRIFGAIGSAELRSAATEAAERVIAAGVPDPDWAASDRLARRSASAGTTATSAAGRNRSR